MYGIAFPEKDLLKDYQYRMEEARKRDHRNVGTQQQLFMFDRLSPGSAFFLPAGTIVYNNLVNRACCQKCSEKPDSLPAVKPWPEPLPAGTIVYNTLVNVRHTSAFWRLSTSRFVTSIIFCKSLVNVRCCRRQTCCAIC